MMTQIILRYDFRLFSLLGKTSFQFCATPLWRCCIPKNSPAPIHRRSALTTSGGRGAHSACPPSSRCQPTPLLPKRSRLTALHRPYPGSPSGRRKRSHAPPARRGPRHRNGKTRRSFRRCIVPSTTCQHANGPPLPCSGHRRAFQGPLSNQSTLPDSPV